MTVIIVPGRTFPRQPQASVGLRPERLPWVSSGTIVDATIINAPSSTKNASGEHDPEMHQGKERNQWYFRMNAHRRPQFCNWVRASVATGPAAA
jgi:hypothetical protein